uniref:Uncharacterized protein n=1 Tax=Cucumis melo TaxID=3656 RepID=A0A9I9ECZ1_CUCME
MEWSCYEIQLSVSYFTLFLNPPTHDFSYFSNFFHPSQSHQFLLSLLQQLPPPPPAYITFFHPYCRPFLVVVLACAQSFKRLFSLDFIVISRPCLCPVVVYIVLNHRLHCALHCHHHTQPSPFFFLFLMFLLVFTVGNEV